MLKKEGSGYFTITCDFCGDADCIRAADHAEAWAAFAAKGWTVARGNPARIHICPVRAAAPANENRPQAERLPVHQS